MPISRRNALTGVASLALLVVALAAPATGQQVPAPPLYLLLPAEYSYSLIRVRSTQWGICAIPVTVRPGTPCQCVTGNGAWVPGVCAH